jgi:hypothetical protein
MGGRIVEINWRRNTRRFSLSPATPPSAFISVFVVILALPVHVDFIISPPVSPVPVGAVCVCGCVCVRARVLVRPWAHTNSH